MGTSQQFRLKWNSYGNNLASAFGKLLESEKLSDLSIFCEGDIYKAHKVVLAANSKHFQELFERTPTSQTLVLMLDGTSSVNIRALLQFMYNGEVYVEERHLASFLKIAESLQVRGLSIADSSFHELGLIAPDDSNNSESLDRERDRQSSESRSQQSQPSVIERSKKSSNRNEQYENETYQPHSHAPPTSNYSTTSNSVIHPTYNLSQYHSPVGNNSRESQFLSGSLLDNRRKRAHLGVPPASTPHVHTSPCAIDDDKPHIKQERDRDREAMDSELMHRLTAAAASSGSTFHVNPGGGGGTNEREECNSGTNQTEVVEENSSPVMPRSREGTMPEDLRIKMEPRDGEALHRFSSSGESPLSPPKHTSSMEALSPSWSTFAQHQSVPDNINSTDNSTVAVQSAETNFSQDLIPTKVGEGKKLKCPFCERLYGYETNLRAHIRQRHQGIRVPCPFCTRTFTRNNTVRRHIAREHRTLIGTATRGIVQRSLSPPSGMVNSSRVPPTSSPQNYMASSSTTSVSAITHTSRTSYGVSETSNAVSHHHMTHHHSDRQGFNPPAQQP